VARFIVILKFAATFATTQLASGSADDLGVMLKPET